MRKNKQSEKMKARMDARSELILTGKHTCSKCNEIKSLECFYWNNGTSAPHSLCKECCKNYYESKRNTEPYAAKKEMVARLICDGAQKCTKCGVVKEFKEFEKSYHVNPATGLSTGYITVCRECKNRRSRELCELRASPEALAKRKIKAKRSAEIAFEKEARELRSEEKKKLMSHPDYKENQRKRAAQKRKENFKKNPIKKIRHALRRRLRKILKKGGMAKTGSHIRDLGCTVEELKIYLISKFKKGMTLDNHGSVWHIDHIIPLASFDLSNRAELLKACHYTNLQPLFSSDNLKKSANIPAGQQFCLL